ncbi:MarR family winged helix-turn-helix transcriptional regulator [Actinomadura hibisca]|uniref:MarR family winged helix-turn-helix transcriptional regulator n=1 Tax=Actinomadura hibisca TaxID=68565 RepID=UPI00082AAB2E|nr:helix-turn-helix domain-containing protein [Actinomadura hibisca]
MSEATERDQSIETIRRELTAFARRARALAERLHPGLSLVSYSLLAHMEERGGCRAADLAAYFLLDKSTVSRQIAALDRLGMVEREAEGQARILRPTERGRAALADAARRQREAFGDRLDEWSDADLADFAASLVRYNAVE